MDSADFVLEAFSEVDADNFSRVFPDGSEILVHLPYEIASLRGEVRFLDEWLVSMLVPQVVCFFANVARVHKIRNFFCVCNRYLL